MCLKRLLCWEFAVISAQTICSNAVTDCCYDLTVDSQLLTVDLSNV